MRNLFIATTLLPFAVTAAAADAINVSVTELRAGVSSSVDTCHVIMQVENTSDEALNLVVALQPQLKEGSMSAILAPAGNSFGNDNVLQYNDVQPQTTVTEEERLLGVVCSDLTGLMIKPECKSATTQGADCTAQVVRSAVSIVPLTTEADPTPIGGLPDTSPKGPMHGQWTITSNGSNPIFTLNITQQLDESAVGTFSSHPALCVVIKQPGDCPQGQIRDKELRYISLNNDKVVVTAKASDDSADKFNMIWGFEAGTGKLGNINSANLAPFTATKSE